MIVSIFDYLLMRWNGVMGEAVWIRINPRCEARMKRTGHVVFEVTEGMGFL